MAARFGSRASSVAARPSSYNCREATFPAEDLSSGDGYDLPDPPRADGGHRLEAVRANARLPPGRTRPSSGRAARGAVRDGAPDRDLLEPIGALHGHGRAARCGDTSPGRPPGSPD